MEIEWNVLIREIINKYILYFFIGVFLCGVLVGFLSSNLKRNLKGNTTELSPGCLEDIGSSVSVVTVDLSGAVVSPGLYTVDKSTRVGELLALGGGLTDEASGLWISRKLNLSAKINDSQKIYIPFEWEIYEDSVGDVQSLFSQLTDFSGSNNDDNSTEDNVGDDSSPVNNGDSDDDTNTDTDTNSNSSSSSNPEKINVNAASLTQLDSLSGIGPSYAQKIIDNRTYADFDDLCNKSKVPKSTLEKLKNDISF
ncbi:hypothetical protein A3K42_00200 [candidate division WWE3 bacterium RBG_13_37_7]|uniref:Soluble ligand binding domain-containing protein n=1 Tax=candidate division WWE3 bacterium RBG_13_37_7 TaxID=1802609 RepID=A0A1F4U177_UNCKA|nr:MAG: hypothetical protein A3K42_00200 [candidate division WWE3 bacterium RBG_13_37_7]